MNDLPPEDQPDVVWVGPVGPIPIHYQDDPRFEEERAAWSHARKKAQALHSAEELLLCPRERSDGSCHERGDSSGGIQKRLLPPGPPWMRYSPSSTSTWS